MADDPVRRRSRRAATRIERQRSKALDARTRKAERYDHRRRPRANSVDRDTQTCRLRPGQMILGAEPAYANRGGPIHRCRPEHWSWIPRSRNISRWPPSRHERLLRG